MYIIQEGVVLKCLIYFFKTQIPLVSIIKNKQTYFRRAQGCSDRLYLLRHILQQYVEISQPLTVALGDSAKPFDGAQQLICNQHKN